MYNEERLAVHQYVFSKRREVEVMLIYCCEEHVELAVDVIIDEKETFPILEEVNSIHNLSTTCEYCEKPSIYIVSNGRSHT